MQGLIENTQAGAMPNQCSTAGRLFISSTPAVLLLLVLLYLHSITILVVVVVVAATATTTTTTTTTITTCTIPGSRVTKTMTINYI